MPTPLEELADEARRARIAATAARFNLSVELLDPIPKVEADITTIAQRFYDWRQLHEIPGDAETDWREAEKYVSFANFRLQHSHRPITVVEADGRARHVAHRRDSLAAQKVRKFLRRRLTSVCRLFRSTDEVKETIGCGASAISTLTGEYPPLLNEMYPTRLIAPDEMRRHLTENGFEVTVLDESWLNPSDFEQLDFVVERHLLLVSFRAAKEQNSWAILWNDQMFHNYTIEKLRTTRLLGRVLNLYLLWRPEWVDDVQARYNTLCRIRPEGAPELDDALEIELAGMTEKQFVDHVKAFHGK